MDVCAPGKSGLFPLSAPGAGALWMGFLSLQGPIKSTHAALLMLAPPLHSLGSAQGQWSRSLTTHI
jgi:hypothetical protein